MALALKIMGLCAILHSVAFSGPVSWASWSDPTMFLPGVLPILVYLGAGVCLVAFSGRIAAGLVKSSGESESPAIRVGPGFEVVAIGLLGLFDLIQSLPILLNAIFWVATHREMGLAWHFGEGLLESALRVALGLWLVLGARGWANALRKLRGVGLTEGEKRWEAREDSPS